MHGIVFNSGGARVYCDNANRHAVSFPSVCMPCKLVRVYKEVNYPATKEALTTVRSNYKAS